MAQSPNQGKGPNQGKCPNKGRDPNQEKRPNQRQSPNEGSPSRMRRITVTTPDVTVTQQTNVTGRSEEAVDAIVAVMDPEERLKNLIKAAARKPSKPYPHACPGGESPGRTTSIAKMVRRVPCGAGQYENVELRLKKLLPPERPEPPPASSIPTTRSTQLKQKKTQRSTRAMQRIMSQTTLPPDVAKELGFKEADLKYLTHLMSSKHRPLDTRKEEAIRRLKKMYKNLPPQLKATEPPPLFSENPVIRAVAQAVSTHRPETSGLDFSIDFDDEEASFLPSDTEEPLDLRITGGPMQGPLPEVRPLPIPSQSPRSPTGSPRDMALMRRRMEETAKVKQRPIQLQGKMYPMAQYKPIFGPGADIPEMPGQEEAEPPPTPVRWDTRVQRPIMDPDQLKKERLKLTTARKAPANYPYPYPGYISPPAKTKPEKIVPKREKWAAKPLSYDIPSTKSSQLRQKEMQLSSRGIQRALEQPDLDPRLGYQAGDLESLSQILLAKWRTKDRREKEAREKLQSMYQSLHPQVRARMDPALFSEHQVVRDVAKTIQYPPSMFGVNQEINWTPADKYDFDRDKFGKKSTATNKGKEVPWISADQYDFDKDRLSDWNLSKKSVPRQPVRLYPESPKSPPYKAKYRSFDEGGKSAAPAYGPLPKVTPLPIKAKPKSPTGSPKEYNEMRERVAKARKLPERDIKLLGKRYPLTQFQSQFDPMEGVTELPIEEQGTPPRNPKYPVRPASPLEDMNQFKKIVKRHELTPGFTDPDRPYMYDVLTIGPTRAIELQGKQAPMLGTVEEDEFKEEDEDEDEDEDETEEEGTDKKGEGDKACEGGATCEDEELPSSFDDSWDPDNYPALRLFD